jgi:hypothetical protein
VSGENHSTLVYCWCNGSLNLTEDQIMVIAGIPREQIRHMRAVQDWLAEGRQEGR